MHVPKELRKKLGPVSEKGWFVGYEANAAAYRFLRERDGRILVSRDVIIDEGGAAQLEVDDATPQLPERAVVPVPALPEPAPNLKLEEEDLSLVAEERAEPAEERRYPARVHTAP